MHSLLPPVTGTRVVARAGRLDTKALASVDQLILLLPERVTEKTWKQIPGGLKLKKLAAKRAAGSVPALLGRLDNPRQTLVVAGGLKAADTSFDRLTLAAKLVAAVTDEKAGTLGIAALGIDPASYRELFEPFLTAALAKSAPMPAWQQSPGKSPIRRIRLLGLEENWSPDKAPLSRIVAEANGNHLARWLTALPPNRLDAKNYTDLARSLAKDKGWEFKRYTIGQLEKLGAGAFLAVAQGNADQSAGIVRLRYRPAGNKTRARVSLVGKGIIFDTGGTNLKPFQSMLDMHGDMQGSAVALGTLLALSQLEVPFAVDCWLAITENRTGPNAYKSQDLIRALNGKTIQTIHTDAEGRMALADALTLASRERPELIVDYATLTGSCVDAITTRYSGVFSNRPKWHPVLKRTGAACGERVWPFPMGKEFLAELESPVADLMQCSVKGTGDHILAASFLNEFIEHDTPWIHIDLSASEHEGGLGAIPGKVTGFGVRYTLALLMDSALEAQAHG
ncbi:MAG: leucyl aminopeptidase family protein [Pseudomonadota bacterium]